jgi:hypothetical protein
LYRVPISETPSRDELLKLLNQARQALVDSQSHWSAVVHLTGDRRFQRQQAQALELIDAMHRRVASYTQPRD